MAMKYLEKIQHMKSLIQKQLVPLIDGDYVLLDLPYYSNVGDSLIWQGEEDFLKTLPYKCLYKSGIRDVSYVKKYVKPDTVILCQGGGNFGDFWPDHQLFRRQVIESFPNNRIVILPQSIGFCDQNQLVQDSHFFSKYPNVIICVRDKMSLEVAEKFFKDNPHLLVPDMAFFMDVSKYKKNKVEKKSTIFLKRNDKELDGSLDYTIVPKDADVKDWLSHQDHNKFLWKTRLMYRCSLLDKMFKTTFEKKVNDYFWNHYLRNVQVQEAIDDLSLYDIIYTTRMHAVILSVLLGKEKIYYFDNSYGKTSSLVETWLFDLDSISEAT